MSAAGGAGAGRRAIFISGGGAGIGRRTAELFASRGWLVGVYDIDEAAAAATREAIGERACVAGRLDVTDPESWRAALADFWEASGHRLDVLLNNAGIIVTGPLASGDPGALRRVLDVNVLGVVLGCRMAYEYLRMTAGAHVINMCSASAIYGQPDIAVYSASKFAVRGLTEALELEWRSEAIRVSAIWPLWVRTALADAAASSRTTTSLGVRLSTDDVADAIWEAANAERRRARVHRIVGRQTRALAGAAKVSPNAATRWLVGRLSGS